MKAFFVIRNICRGKSALIYFKKEMIFLCTKCKNLPASMFDSAGWEPAGVAPARWSMWGYVARVYACRGALVSSVWSCQSPPVWPLAGGELMVERHPPPSPLPLPGWDTSYCHDTQRSPHHSLADGQRKHQTELDGCLDNSMCHYVSKSTRDQNYISVKLFQCM